MANFDMRDNADYQFGQLDLAVTALDTTLASSSFTSLGTSYTTTRYMPIVLSDDARKVYEVVWITGHNQGSSTVTVVRGKENSTAQAWPAGTPWRAAPTVRETPMVSSLGGLPTDAHIGARAVTTDDNYMREKTALQGWLPTARGTAAGMKPTMQGNLTPPAGVVPIIKAFHAQATTDGTGSLANWPWPDGGFPTAVAAAVATPMYIGGENFVGYVRMSAVSATAATWQCFQSNGSVLANTLVNLNIIAVGY